MTESAEPGNTRDQGVVSLESIVCTDELPFARTGCPTMRMRLALVALAEMLSDSPRTVLQSLADTILDVRRAGSAGVSLLTKEDGGKRFYWPAIAGEWKPYCGGNLA